MIHVKKKKSDSWLLPHVAPLFLHFASSFCWLCRQIDQIWTQCARCTVREYFRRRPERGAPSFSRSTTFEPRSPSNLDTLLARNAREERPTARLTVYHFFAWTFDYDTIACTDLLQNTALRESTFLFCIVFLLLGFCPGAVGEASDVKSHTKYARRRHADSSWRQPLSMCTFLWALLKQEP